MRTRDTDLIVTMVDFERPGVGTHQYMSQSSFEENVINNEYFQKALEAGLIKCLLTHQGRDYADNDKSGTPYDDLLATHPDLCGVVRDVWLEGSKAMASIDLFDGQAFPAAAKLKDLIKKGTFVGVSMATECEINPQGNYDIKALLGCDFTLDNFFMGSGIVTIKKNFSRMSGTQKVNFSNNRVQLSKYFDKEERIMNFADEEEIAYLISEHGIDYLNELDPDKAPMDNDFVFESITDAASARDLVQNCIYGGRYLNDFDYTSPLNAGADYFVTDGEGHLFSIDDVAYLEAYLLDNINADDFISWCEEQGFVEEETENEA